MARELCLIVKANEGRHVGRLHAATQQLLRACDAEVRQIRVRRHSDLRTKDAAQVELVEVCVVCEIVERDRVVESFAQVFHHPSDGTRMAGMCVADERQPIDSFRDSDLEREAVRPCAHGIDQAVKRRGAFVVGVELRDS
jgi:hypothetical protein